MTTYLPAIAAGALYASQTPLGQYVKQKASEVMVDVAQQLYAGSAPSVELVWNATKMAAGAMERPSRPPSMQHLMPEKIPKNVVTEKPKHAGGARVIAPTGKSAANERTHYTKASLASERVVPNVRTAAPAAAPQAVYPSMAAQPTYVAHVTHSSHTSAAEAPRRFRNYYPKEEAPPKRKRRPRAR
jgi:hypothetical protein